MSKERRAVRASARGWPWHSGSERARGFASSMGPAGFALGMAVALVPLVLARVRDSRR